ncbi:MAG: GreA/GreB family elongation factor [Gemmatimonadota bacterium]|nr:GreA/GreB family elongation factor [Gemmatimonadota bacterium]MDE2983360.1 GreA/GreB family elongation factor [Gemmatimonadota bacterium]
MDRGSSFVNADGPKDTPGGPPHPDDPAGGLPLFDRHLRIESLAERLHALAADFERGTFATRDEVVDGILIPLLQQLGWNTGDPGVVAPDLRTAADAVDLALCHPPGDPRILIKVGALPESAGAPNPHPFDDPSTRALQLAVSDDGRDWQFHFPAGRGSIRNRRFARFDIVDGAKEHIALTLDTYLSFHAAKSREAFREAGRDYGRKRFPAEACAAWRRAVTGREVVRRFLREVEETVGVATDRRQALGYVRAQMGSLSWPPDPPDPTPARRVEVGDKVYVYDFDSREIVRRVVVGCEPDWNKGEVSRDSPIGYALLGAHEGEEREVGLPGQDPSRIRIVLIADA